MGTVVLLVLGAAILLWREASESRELADPMRPPGKAGSRGGNSQTDRPGKSPRSVHGLASKRVIFSGPTGLAGWTLVSTSKDGKDPKDRWEFIDGRLASKAGGGIAREISTPPIAKLGFTLEWQGDLRVRILFGADSADSPRPGNCFELVIQRSFLFLRKNRWKSAESRGSRTLGEAQIAALTESPAHLEIYYDRTDGVFALYVNKVRQTIWVDPEPTIGTFGNWLQFVAEDSHDIQLSELSVERWSGQLPDAGSEYTTEEFVRAEEARQARLKPTNPWEPEQKLNREAAVIGENIRRAEAEGGASSEETVAALQLAIVEFQIRLQDALRRLPVAEPDPDQPGHVINPFTGAALDVRGLNSGTRIQDPSDPDPTHTFRVP